MKIKLIIYHSQLRLIKIERKRFLIIKISYLSIICLTINLMTKFIELKMNYSKF